MKTKRQEANPPTSITETSAGVLSKPSRAAWKTGEQLEYLLTHWTGYVTHQNKKTLASFWSRVYDGWYRKWPITPSIESMAKHGSREGAILALRSENNSVRITIFYISYSWSRLLSEDPYVVSQPRPPGFQVWQVRFATQSKREAKACPRPSLLHLCLGFRPSGCCHCPVGGTKVDPHVGG